MGISRRRAIHVMGTGATLALAVVLGYPTMVMRVDSPTARSPCTTKPTRRRSSGTTTTGKRYTHGVFESDRALYEPQTSAGINERNTLRELLSVD